MPAYTAPTKNNNFVEKLQDKIKYFSGFLGWQTVGRLIYGKLMVDRG